MRTFLATWIVIQLFVLGWYASVSLDEVAAGTYDCNLSMQKNRKHTMGIFFPLALFTHNPGAVDAYCQGKLEIK